MKIYPECGWYGPTGRSRRRPGSSSGLSDEYARRNIALARAAGAFNPLLDPPRRPGRRGRALRRRAGRDDRPGHPRRLRRLRRVPRPAGLAADRAGVGGQPAQPGRGLDGAAQRPLRRAALDRLAPAAGAAAARAAGARRLTFEGVWFRYPNAHDRGWVLQDISFDLAAGRSLAVVGATGSGKSTLAELIVRAYDPDRGRILLDGVDIRSLDLRELRRAVGFVPQETFLFSETLRENVLLGAPDDGRLQRAAEVSQLAAARPRSAQWLRHHARRAGNQPLRAARSSGPRSPGRWRRSLPSSCWTTPSRRWTPRPRPGSSAPCAAPWPAAPASSSPTGWRRCATPTGSWYSTQGRVVEEGVHATLAAKRGRYWELLWRQEVEEELEET